MARIPGLGISGLLGEVMRRRQGIAAQAAGALPNGPVRPEEAQINPGEPQFRMNFHGGREQQRLAPPRRIAPPPNKQPANQALGSITNRFMGSLASRFGAFGRRGF